MHILHINRGWCWGKGKLPERYVAKRGYQIECDKPLHRGAGSEWLKGAFLQLNLSVYGETLIVTV